MWHFFVNTKKKWRKKKDYEKHIYKASYNYNCSKPPPVRIPKPFYSMVAYKSGHGVTVLVHLLLFLIAFITIKLKEKMF
jgi:hypothetical protein